MLEENSFKKNESGNKTFLRLTPPAHHADVVLKHLHMHRHTQRLEECRLTSMILDYMIVLLITTGFFKSHLGVIMSKRHTNGKSWNSLGLE